MVPYSTQDADETYYYNQVAFVSFIVTFLSDVILEVIFSLLPFNWCKELSKKNQLLCVTVIPSTVHAVIVSPLATYALLTEADLLRDYVWGKSTLASVSCAITIGYMCADFVYTLLRWKYIGEWGYVFHHIMTVAAYSYVTQTGTFRFYAMVRLLAEYSTPSVNFRLILYKLGYKSSSAYVYNGIVMVLMFFAARIFPLPFYLYTIYLVYGTDHLEATGHGKHMLYASTIVLDTLNLIWFHKMISGAIKVLASYQKTPVSTDERDKFKQG